MKATIVSAALTLFASAAFAAPGVVGNWQFITFTAGPMTVTSVLTISENSTAITATCVSDGQTEVATASSPAIVTDTSFQSLSSADVVTSDKGFNCEASIAPGTAEYSLSADGNTLTLHDGSDSRSFPRVK